MREAASDHTRSNQPFDLSEEGSKRPEGEQSTIAGRQAESDDLDEETNKGPVDSPKDQDLETWCGPHQVMSD